PLVGRRKRSLTDSSKYSKSPVSSSLYVDANPHPDINKIQQSESAISAPRISRKSRVTGVMLNLLQRRKTRVRRDKLSSSSSSGDKLSSSAESPAAQIPEEDEIVSDEILSSSPLVRVKCFCISITYYYYYLCYI